MGIRMALNEMFPLAVGPKTWSYVVMLVYLIQLVRNSSTTDGGLSASENMTSSAMFLTSTPEVTTEVEGSVRRDEQTNISVAQVFNSGVGRESNVDDINYTIIKNKTGNLPDSESSYSESSDDVNNTSYDGAMTSTTTKKPIYIRGHLLQSHSERTFRPSKSKQDFLSPDNPSHRAFLKNFREEPGGEPCTEGDECASADGSGPNIINHIGSPVRRKKKHSTYHGRKKFHNYKLLYDTIRSQNDLHQKETEFYAWIFGAAMLTLGSLTTLASCFVFCFCGDKWRKRREMRKRFDKSGEYQRVDSVSSIVDNNVHHEELYEDQLDSVTII